MAPCPFDPAFGVDDVAGLVEQYDHRLARGGTRAPSGDVARFRETAARFDRPLTIPCPAEAKAQTAQRLAEARRSAAEWLQDTSRFFAGSFLSSKENSLTILQN